MIGSPFFLDHCSFFPTRIIHPSHFISNEFVPVISVDSFWPKATRVSIHFFYMPVCFLFYFTTMENSINEFIPSSLPIISTYSFFANLCLVLCFLCLYVCFSVSLSFMTIELISRFSMDSCIIRKTSRIFFLVLSWSVVFCSGSSDTSPGRTPPTTGCQKAHRRRICSENA